MSECPYCQNTFEMQDTCSDEFRMWQGLQGPYYIPTVDSEGVISWTNTGGLPNPDAVDISGPPGKGLTIKGVVATVGDLPANPEEGDTYLVGATDPYDGYIWLNGTWVELGDISKGETGEGVPTGGTTGQVLAKASSADYDTEWKTPDPGVDPATATPLMDGTAAVGTSTKYAREDHVHPVYDQVARPNLLDNWYFVGGGSQLGSGVFPINQRGQLTYQGSTYTIDRWYSTNSRAITTISSDGLSVVSDNEINWANVEQYFENPARLLGKRITLSMLTTGNELTSATATIPSSFPASTTNIITLTPTSCAGLMLRIDTSKIYLRITTDKTSFTGKIAAIKLELGTTQTLAHLENGSWVLNEIPNYEEQLIRCKTSTADSSDTYANQTIVYEPPYHWGTGFADSPNLQNGQIDVYKMGRFAVASIRFECLANLSWYTLPGITLTGSVVPASEVAAAMISRNQEFICPLVIGTDGVIHFDTARSGYWYTVTVCYITV